MIRKILGDASEDNFFALEVGWSYDIPTAFETSLALLEGGVIFEQRSPGRPGYLKEKFFKLGSVGIGIHSFFL